MHSMVSHKIGLIPGDGIGLEVVESVAKVLKHLQSKLTLRLELHWLDWGSKRYLERGSYAPADFLTQLRAYDAILFGAVGSPDVPDHVSLWELLLPMRQSLGQYANVRPVKSIPGVLAPLEAARDGALDWLIIRENSEGEYAGQGGRTHKGTLAEVVNEIGVFTRIGCERIMRYAFAAAEKRAKKFLTVVTKSNAQRNGLVLWDEVAELVAEDYPAVRWDKMLVDAMTVRMVRHPASLDTIVCTNLHGDILSDLAAGLAGSIGIAPSCNLNPSRDAPSMFEPVHGAAFDIMGEDLANPVAALWSAVEMLRWLDEAEGGDKLEKAILQCVAERKSTRDIGGSLKTSEVTAAVIACL